LVSRHRPHHADRLVKEVRVKDFDSHSVRALLASRALLVKIKRDLENQIRGLRSMTFVVVSIYAATVLLHVGTAAWIVRACALAVEN
jgi:hypothetical protein